MKKAKMVLTAIAVLVVVGGALAFKAQKGRTLYCTTQDGAPCNVVKLDFTITNGTQGIISRCTNIAGIRCDLTVITQDQ